MGQKVQNLQSRKLERVLFTDESLKFTAEIELRFSEFPPVVSIATVLKCQFTQNCVHIPIYKLLAI
jgi:hypothetical protein